MRATRAFGGLCVRTYRESGKHKDQNEN
jgi:hypothetical protein